jgi:hypothetical protein
MTTLDEFKATLASERRALLLSALIYWLGMSGRGAYLEAGTPLEEAAKSLRCHNELMIVVANQLLATHDSSFSGYPDDAFMGVLLEKSRKSSCEDGLRWALEKSIQFGVIANK